MSMEILPNRPLHPIPEARKLLGGISHAGFYNLVGRGLIRMVKLGGRSFVTDDEIENVVTRLEEEERRESESRSAEAAA